MYQVGNNIVRVKGGLETDCDFHAQVRVFLPKSLKWRVAVSGCSQAVESTFGLEMESGMNVSEDH